MTPWRVVLTREAGLNDALRVQFPDDFIVAEVPLTVTRYDDLVDVDERLRRSPFYGHFASLVVTSRRTDRYLPLCHNAMRTPRDVFTVGHSTATSLEEAGFSVTRSTDEGVMTLAPHITTGPVLILGARHPYGDIAGVLSPRLEVTSVACYETGSAEVTAGDAAVLGEADAVVIAAPSAWAVAQPFVQSHTWVLVPGDSTLQAVAATHERVVRAWGPAMVTALRTLREG